ncbi:MAG: HEAT repeat domain-containing protein [Propionibacteriaceae bacterium]
MTDRPRDWLAAAAHELGESRVALWCADLITESVDPADPAAPPLESVSSHPGTYYLERAAAGDPEPDYWPRVWGARGLLYVWDDRAEAAVVQGLQDEAWRVREMCAKVVRLREIGAAGDRLAELCADDVPRVRVAALRALSRVGESEHLPAVHAAGEDEEPTVVAAADDALEELGERLDRDVD